MISNKISNFFARSVLCVAINADAPVLRILSISNCVTNSEDFESRFPVGSSANIQSGLLIKALAIATLCCSPPDKLEGL